jgi:putative ATP-binding cassette transporter
VLTAVLNAVTFVGVLWQVGGNLSIAVLGIGVVIPGYLVIAAVVYSGMMAIALMLVGRRLAQVIDGRNQAEAELKSRAAHLRHSGEASAMFTGATDRHSLVGSALDQVVACWRELCHQLMATTTVTHLNYVLAPVFALLICLPKYVGGAMTLGEVVQAAAAFVIVQGALNWYVDNYYRLADLLSSANRVSSLLLALDNVEDVLDGTAGLVEPERPLLVAQAQPCRMRVRKIEARRALCSKRGRANHGRVGGTPLNLSVNAVG